MSLASRVRAKFTRRTKARDRGPAGPAKIASSGCAIFASGNSELMMRKASVTIEALGDSLLQAIARQGGLHHFPANAVLINEGDNSDSLFILLSGRVKVYSTNADGKEV